MAKVSGLCFYCLVTVLLVTNKSFPFLGVQWDGRNDNRDWRSKSGQGGTGKDDSWHRGTTAHSARVSVQQRETTGYRSRSWRRRAGAYQGTKLHSSFILILFAFLISQIHHTAPFLSRGPSILVFKHRPPFSRSLFFRRIFLSLLHGLICWKFGPVSVQKFLAVVCLLNSVDYASSAWNNAAYSLSLTDAVLECLCM